MARIKQESVEQVKTAADMLDVVGARTQLKKAGARYTGRCPFHEERTPSFSVNPVDKLFYCFGCGKGGDLISFVRETENLDFAGAIEWLGDRFRVPLEYEETSPAADAARKRARAAVRRARAGDVVLRALPLGDRGRASRCARISLDAGSATRSAASSGWGFRRRPRRSRARPPRRASRAPSWPPPGSPTGGATTTSAGG